MIDWNKRNGGFLSPESVYEDQLGNLSMQINQLEKQLDKYKEVLDKIKEQIKENSKNISITPGSVKAVPIEYILELLKEIE